MGGNESQETNGSLPKSIEIPTIGEPWVEGTPFHMEVLQVNRQLTIECIKPYLKVFNLGGLTLKREAMIHQLYQFSQDCNAWKTLYVARPSRYRDQATGSRANRPSAKRARDQFGDDERLEQTTHASKRATISLPDHRTDQDRDEAEDWMNLVLNEREANTASTSNNQATGPAIMHSSSEQQLTHESEESHIQIRRLERQMYNLKEAVTSGMADIISAVGHMESKLLTSRSTDNSSNNNAPPNRQNTLTTTSHIGMPKADESRADAPTASPTIPAEAVDSPESDGMKTVFLDELAVMFDPAKVPSIPAVSFADDIAGLARNWHSSNLLVLGGHGIPIKHWDKIYKAQFNIRKNAWKSFRSTYSDWHVHAPLRCLPTGMVTDNLHLQFMVNEFLSYPTEADFWRAYTNEAGRLPYQKILNKIEQKCVTSKADFSVDADAAREFFDHDLSKAPRSSRQGEVSFSYRKLGKWCVKKSNEEIAKAWR
ncbi:hypothetical protein ARMSODRAFT_1021807 [Armillaria solidipes]|uniref:Uncharacterized protein n=1 Tax=Armillaria solidipes TaxID=1076256 RepID=A0A2H3BPH3_9AGAR|nr:hypothetical protein ARMSODRAFT_1021807 [Armillaria solidipes]